jgi:cytoskeletal protein RodZ
LLFVITGTAWGAEEQQNFVSKIIEIYNAPWFTPIVWITTSLLAILSAIVLIIRWHYKQRIEEKDSTIRQLESQLEQISKEQTNESPDSDSEAPTPASRDSSLREAPSYELSSVAQSILESYNQVDRTELYNEEISTLMESSYSKIEISSGIDELLHGHLIKQTRTGRRGNAFGLTPQGKKRAVDLMKK